MKRQISHALIMIFTLSTYAGSTVFAAPVICENGASVDSAAWSFTSNHKRIFTSDRTEPRNEGVSTSEKKSRVLKRIKKYHNGVSGMDASELAATIVWASECTGNDFTYLAGVFEVESMYCKARHNTGGGDSGCGQFTSAAINVLKNQLRLPGQQKNNNASLDAKKSIEGMIKNCYAKIGQPERYKDFINLFKKDRTAIQSKLRAGTDLDIDILASAVFLKFMVALAGGYIVPGSKPGGLAMYNGGGVPNYAGKVNDRAQNVSYLCVEDEYSAVIGNISCSIQEGTDSCPYNPWETIEI